MWFSESHGKQDKSDKFRSYTVVELVSGSVPVGVAIGIDRSSVSTLLFVWVLSRFVISPEFSGVGLSWELLFRPS